jgi:hypothetical protein
MIKRGASIVAVFITGVLPHTPGALAQQESVAPHLERQAAFERILFGGIRFNNVARVQEALESGLDPNLAKDPFSDMPALFVAVHGASAKPDIIKLLIQHGANVNARWTPTGPLVPKGTVDTNREYFPLYWAAMNNNAVGSKALLEGGADVHARTGGLGMTALFATYDPAVAEALIGAGAQMNAKNAQGDTVLGHAQKRLASVETLDAKELLRPKLMAYVAWLKGKGAKE